MTLNLYLYLGRVHQHFFFVFDFHAITPALRLAPYCIRSPGVAIVTIDPLHPPGALRCNSIKQASRQMPPTGATVVAATAK